MGNILGLCAGKKKAPVEVSDGSLKEKAKEETKVHTKEIEEKEKWEMELLRKNVGESTFVTQAAILKLADGSLRASLPKDFALDEKGVQAIVVAFGAEGNSSQLTEHGLTFGESTYRPESSETGGKVIVCSDGGQGGCILEKAAQCILVLVFKQDREDATKMAAEIAKSIENHED